MKYLPNGGCGVVSFELKGGRAEAETFMKHLKLAAIETPHPPFGRYFFARS